MFVKNGARGVKSRPEALVLEAAWFSLKSHATLGGSRETKGLFHNIHHLVSSASVSHLYFPFTGSPSIVKQQKVQLSNVLPSRVNKFLYIDFYILRYSPWTPTYLNNQNQSVVLKSFFWQHEESGSNNKNPKTILCFSFNHFSHFSPASWEIYRPVSRLVNPVTGC